MEDGKQYLDDDADATERAAAAAVMAGLDELRLEQTVRRAAKRRLARRRRWRWFLVLVALLSLGLGAWLWWRSRSEPEIPRASPSDLRSLRADTLRGEQAPPVLTPAEDTVIYAQEDPPEDPVVTPPVATSPPEQLAQALPWEKLAPPAHPAPRGGMRGGVGTQEEREQLLNEIWYLDYPLTGLKVEAAFPAVDSLLRVRNFPRAFLELRRLEQETEMNDTLRFLKGYTFLQMGRGKEAVTLLEEIEPVAPAWRAQRDWYRGLGLLLAGRKREARTLFSGLTEDADHPYALPAGKAAYLLRK
ncbi:MAG: hypothetical protein AAFN92_06300 [Bacteroidota bacterium]